jgi:hypothetical protein
MALLSFLHRLSKLGYLQFDPLDPFKTAITMQTLVQTVQNLQLLSNPKYLLSSGTPFPMTITQGFKTDKDGRQKGF